MGSAKKKTSLPGNPALRDVGLQLPVRKAREEGMKRKKLIFCVFGLLVLNACVAWQIKPSLTEQSHDIYPKRYLKVMILSEDDLSDEMIFAVKESFDEFEKNVGIGVGDITFQKIDLQGVKTGSQVYRKLFSHLIPQGPKQADLFICFTSRFYVEDLFMLLGVGPQLGGCELVFQRFIMMRNCSSSILEHEIAHAFGARDLYSPDENVRIVLSQKWRKFDGWYMKNPSEGSMNRKRLEKSWEHEGDRVNADRRLLISERPWPDANGRQTD
jgi:hypothetical protein